MRWWQAGDGGDRRFSEGWLGWQRQQSGNGWLCWWRVQRGRQNRLEMARRDRLNAQEAVDLRHRQTKVRQDSKKTPQDKLQRNKVGLRAVTTWGTEQSGKECSEELGFKYCRSWLVDGEQVCRMGDSQRWLRPRPDKQSHADTERETDRELTRNIREGKNRGA